MTTRDRIRGALNRPKQLPTSLADLLASKLDVIMYGPKLRDYIDLSAIDAMSPYFLEDGLAFHFQRYGIAPSSDDATRIIQLLEDPGELDHDAFFDDNRDQVLTYLANRAPDLKQHLNQMRLEQSSTTSPDPPNRTMKTGTTESFDEAIRSVPAAPPSTEGSAASVCGHIGVRSGKPCILPPGHTDSTHEYD